MKWVDPSGLAGCVDEDFMTLYRGTDTASAAAIRESGVANVGRSSLDFGKGFYTTENESQAIKCAAKVQGDGPGEVLTFNVPRSQFDQLNTKSFDFANSDWASFVKNNR